MEQTAPSVARLRFLVADRELRYSSGVRLAVQRNWSMLATNEGGRLPRATTNLYDALSSDDPELAQAAWEVSGCRYLYLDDHGWQPVEDVLPRIHLESSHAGEVPDLVSDPELGEVELLSENPQQLAVRVRATVPVQLVIADTFYPGWTARIDGRPAEILLAYGSFRGEHLVEWAYEPAAFWWGVWLSLAGLLCAGALLLLERFGSSARQQPESNAAAVPSVGD